MPCWPPNCMCLSRTDSCSADAWLRRWMMGWPRAGYRCSLPRDPARARRSRTEPEAADSRSHGSAWMTAIATRFGSGATRLLRSIMPGQGWPNGPARCSIHRPRIHSPGLATALINEFAVSPCHRCPWRGCGPAVSWLSCAPPTCASRLKRRQRCWPRQPVQVCRTLRRRRWRRAPRGRPRDSSCCAVVARTRGFGGLRGSVQR